MPVQVATEMSLAMSQDGYRNETDTASCQILLQLLGTQSATRGRSYLATQA